MAKKNTVAPQKGPVFNPNTNYRWEKDTKFEFTGEEFAFMFNNLNKFLSGNLSPQSFFTVLDVSMILQAKLAEAVASGDATEMEQEAEQP